MEIQVIRSATTGNQDFRERQQPEAQVHRQLAVVLDKYHHQGEILKALKPGKIVVSARKRGTQDQVVLRPPVEFEKLFSLVIRADWVAARDKTLEALGRPDRLPSGTSDVFTKKNRDSKSGTVGYDNSHNVKSLGRPVAIGEVPRIENNRIRHEGFGENRIISIDNRYRNGYVFYNDRWCDNDFYYPYYGFNWYRGCDYVFSPFYYYGHLFSYISCTRITFGIFTWTQCNSRYDWSPPRYDNYGYGGQRAFDSAVFDIQRSFEREAT